MKHARVLCCIQLLFCLSLVVAQETKPKIGIGVSLNPTALLSTSSSSIMFLPVGFTNIHVPFDVGKNFRVEPEAGIFTYSYETTAGGSTSSSSTSIIRIGSGFFYQMPVDETFNTYVGPRVGLLFSTETSKSSSSSTEYKTSETDFSVGLALGGEYLISPHFSLGGEVQLNYVSFGEPSVTPSSSTNATVTRSLFTNNALVFFRWYYQ
jgi:hypothetical protein